MKVFLQLLSYWMGSKQIHENSYNAKSGAAIIGISLNVDNVALVIICPPLQVAMAMHHQSCWSPVPPHRL